MSLKPEDDLDPAPPEDALGELSIAEEELAIRERLRVDPNCLDEDLSRCASDIAYVGARQARAVLAHGRAKIATKKMRAVAFIEAKQTAVDVYGEKKATVDTINAMVEGGELETARDYLAVADEEVVAEARLAIAKTNVTAAVARKDMLQQVGASRRAEMERDGYVASRGRNSRGSGSEQD